MEWGGLTTTAVAMSLASLCIRWRLPSVPPLLATAGVGASLCVAVLSLFSPPVPFAASLALNAALIAAGVDYWRLQKARASPSLENAATDAKQGHRRQLIADGRMLVAAFNRQTRYENAIDYLQRQNEWHAIRAQLDPKVRRDMENGRRMVVTNDNVKDGKIYYLINELDRLEREWGLV